MLPDLLAPGLRVVFVGTSVGDRSAERERYYANPTNKFWDPLDATGLTDHAGLTCERDREILDHRLGLTDLVRGRAASSDARLVAGDYDVAGFIERMTEHKPEIIAFNGGTSATKVARHFGHAAPAEGPTVWRVADACAYRLASSSGANAAGGYLAKKAKWIAFGAWVRDQDEQTDRAAGS